MHRDIVDLVVCPDCRGKILILSEFATEGNDVIDGTLSCPLCRRWYRIENGVLDLLPISLRRNDIYEAFARKYYLTLDVKESVGSLPKKQQIEFFAKDAAHYERDVTQSPYFKTLDDVIFIPWLASQVSIGCRFLEVGVGTGRQCVRIAKRGVRVVGIDISEEMLLVARAIAEERGVLGYVDLIIADAEALPFRKASFAAAAAVGTLHHVPDPLAVIKEMARVLCVGAPVFTCDPHRSPVRFLFDALMRWWKLYDEKASENPMMNVLDLTNWMHAAGVSCVVRVSTYVPPHIFYVISPRLNRLLLRSTDFVFNAIPGLRYWGGMVLFTGVCTYSCESKDSV